LIEQIAQLLEEKKLPLLGDVRDESTDVVRLVLEPKTRTVEPAVLMETMFRATTLESRFPLNMNVLDAERTPRVMSLREVLRSWLDHRHVVLVRRTEHRLAAIARRLEILDGYLIAYLNLDEVIRIIRAEDEPKPVLMATFALTDLQADSILNMRLRSLRKLEEMEIRKEHKKLSAEQKKLQGLMSSDAKRWAAIAEEIEATRLAFGDGPLGRRRTETGRILPAVLVDEAAFVEREPITVILTEKGSSRSTARSASRKATACSSPCTPRPPTASWSSPPTARLTPSRPTPCRAGVATASRCAWWSTSRTRTRWWPCSSTATPSGSWSRPPTARASS